MKVLFWVCLALVGYAYIGYAMLLAVLARVRTRPIAKTSFNPMVSVIMAVRNEEKNLPAKLDNLRRLDYPQSHLQIVIVSDGSTDATAAILAEAQPMVVPVILQRSSGKATALNEGVRRSQGEILFFLDARQTVDPSAVSKLISCFADAEVGAVSGELLLESSTGEGTSNALGLYWKIEKMMRKLESATGSVVGVTGAIYAIRRELYREIPAGTILDDVFVPMNVARQGKRVVFEPLAIARDKIFSEKGKEFSRKVRTLGGNYQLLQIAPWLLSASNPLLFRFISHKLVRLAVPFLLLLMLAASATVSEAGYRAIFVAQIAFYLTAILGELRPGLKQFKLVGIANTFVMLNAAAALAFYNFITGRTSVWG